MSEVKRYVLLDQAEDVGIEASYINAPTLVVKASDHDALAARLAAAENGFNNACHRIRELEAALAEGFRLVATRSYNAAWDHLRPYAKPEMLGMATQDRGGEHG